METITRYEIKEEDWKLCWQLHQKPYEILWEGEHVVLVKSKQPKSIVILMFVREAFAPGSDNQLLFHVAKNSNVSGSVTGAVLYTNRHLSLGQSFCGDVVRYSKDVEQRVIDYAAGADKGYLAKRAEGLAILTACRESEARAQNLLTELQGLFPGSTVRVGRSIPMGFATPVLDRFNIQVEEVSEELVRKIAACFSR